MMKKLTTLALGLVAVCSLTACGDGKGTKTSEEDFKKKAEAVQEPATPYTSATFKYKGTVKGSTFLGEEETKLDSKLNGSIEFTYENGKWSAKDKADDETVESYVEMVGVSIKEMIAEDSFDMEGQGTVTYYSNPLGVEITYDGKTDGAAMSGNAYMAFNGNGYLSKVEVNMKMDMTVEMAGVKSGTVATTKFSATISYK